MKCFNIFFIKINFNKMAEVKRTYYKNGTLSSEYFEINGKKEGEFKSYYENGQLGTICMYIDGQLRSICSYIDNKITGKYIIK